MNQPKDPQEAIREVLNEAYLAFKKKEESAIFEEIVRLFNDGTLELVVLQQYQTQKHNDVTIHGGVGVRLGPKIQALQSKLEKAEAEAKAQLDINKALLRRIGLLELQALKGEEK